MICLLIKDFAFSRERSSRLFSRRRHVFDFLTGFTSPLQRN